MEQQQALLAGINTKLLSMGPSDVGRLALRESGLDPLIAKYQSSHDIDAVETGTLRAYKWTELKDITAGFGIEKSIGGGESGTVYLAAQVGWVGPLGAGGGGCQAGCAGVDRALLLACWLLLLGNTTSIASGAACWDGDEAVQFPRSAGYFTNRGWWVYGAFGLSTSGLE